MNFEDEGLDILKLYKNESDKKGKTIYITPDEDKVNTPIKEITLKKGESVRLVPPKKRERSVLYITGQSGSGKSFFTGRYILEYKKVYPTRKVYLFSSLDKDPTLDKIKAINRIPLNEKFLETNFDISDFQNTLICFDDIDVVVNKMLKKKLFNILNNLLQCGRHQNTDVIYTSHVACAGNDTKIILGEATSVTLFPKTLGARTCRYLLEQYFGFDKNEIRKLKKLKSRPVTIIKSYPSIVLYDGGAYVKELED